MKPRKKRLTQSQRLSKVALLSACFCFFYFDQGYAAIASDYFDLSPEQLLGARVLSASKKEEKVAEAPAAVYVITQEDIARSGVTNIPDALRMAPGVDVAQVSADSWAISIRGFNSTNANKILVMIDGRTVYSPLFAGTYWEVQNLPLEDIERIEVVRGPGGTLWGANAVNGVINIITKNAKDTRGGLVSGGIGNRGQGLGLAQYGGAMPDNGAYRVYAQGLNHGSFSQPDGDGNHDSWRDGRTGFRMDWGGAKTPDQVSVHGDYYATDTEEFNQSFTLNGPPFSSIAGETIESHGANIMGLWNHKYDDGSAMKLQSYLDYTLHDQVLYRDSRYIFDAEGQYNFAPIDRHELVVGVNYRLMADSLAGSSEITFDPSRRTDSIYGAFIQDKITLQPNRWFLTLGSKFEQNYYTGFDMQPNARLSWLYDTHQTFWAAVSHAVRTPSTEERDLNLTNIVLPPNSGFGPLPVEVVLAANRNYGAEDLIAYELGYRNQITPDFSIDATAYANDYRNLSSAIIVDPHTINGGADLLLPVVAVNQMSGEVYGAELAASWNVRTDWKLSAGYTFMDMFLHAPSIAGFGQETAEKQSPNHQANLRSSWNINENWTLDASVYYVDRLSAFDVPAYIRTDLNLGWRLSKNLHFNLIGQNFLDGSHREFDSPSTVNAAEIPRTVFGKFTWQF